MTIRRKPFHEDLAKTNNLLGRLYIHQGNQLLRQSQSQLWLKAKQPVKPIGGSSSVSVPVFKCGIHNYETTNPNDWNMHIREYSHGDTRAQREQQAVKSLMEMFSLPSVDYTKGYQSKPRPELIGASAAAVVDPKLKAINELRKWMKLAG